MTSERKRAARSTQKATRGKMLDYNDESEDSFDESDNFVGNKTKTGCLYKLTLPDSIRKIIRKQ